MEVLIRGSVMWSIVISSILCGAVFPRATAQYNRPNIIIILADDLGFSDIGCYGSEIQTPNLDQLAAEGLRFTQFYNTARCCPTRASLLSGLYPHQAGIGHMMDDRGTDGYRGDLSDDCVTIAEVLGANGYLCYMSGKWHVTKQTGIWTGNTERTSKHNWPLQRGFDRFFGTIHGAGSYFDPVTLTRDNEPIEIPDDIETFYYTDAISDHASQFIREHHSDEPFFLYIAYTAPHWPLHALPEDIEKYRGRYDAGWDAIRSERYQRMTQLGLIDKSWPLSPRDRGVVEWSEAPYPEWQKRAMEVYAAMVDRMDQGIGRVIQSLRETQNIDNTLIFFLADNGGCAEGGTAFTKEGWHGGLSQARKQTRDGRPVHFGHYAEHMPGTADTYQEYGKPWANVSNTPFRMYKHWVHEGGISTPLIVHWPNGIDAKSNGRWRSQPGHVIDLMATCVDVAGAVYPERRDGIHVQPMEGVSLVPTFGDKPLADRAIFWEHEGNRAVRVGDWKLVARGRKGAWELYNLRADRSELNNLAAEFPERVAIMSALWLEWAKRCKVLPWPK